MLITDFIKFYLVITRPNSHLPRLNNGPNGTIMINLVHIKTQPLETAGKSIAQVPSRLNMAVFNIRALSNKSFCVNDLIADHMLDCLLLTETWLGLDASATFIEACPANYVFSHFCREGRKGGGTAAILTKTLKCKNIDRGVFSSFKYNALILNCQPQLLSVTICRPPKLYFFGSLSCWHAFMLNMTAPF